jgi:Tfp pilus assembly protein PilO
MKKTNTRPLLMLFIILALIGAGLWYFLFSSIRSHVEAAANFNSETQDKLAAANRDESLKAFLADSTSTIALLSQSIVSSDGTVSFIDNVEGLARGMDLGIAVSSVSTSGISASSTALQDLDLSLSVQGSWSACYQFLSALETLPNDISITSVNLSQSTFAAGGVKTGSWNETIALSALMEK